MRFLKPPRPQGMFETAVVRLVRSGQYTEHELDLIMRRKWSQLSDEGKWIHILLVQAGFELIDYQDQQRPQ